MKKNLLLHTCCAPCLIYPLSALKEKFEVTIFYYNPNIHPLAEYKKRLKTLRRYCFENKLNIIVDNYTPADYYKKIKVILRQAQDSKKKRCLECYKTRLQRTAEHATRLGFKNFSTTLMVSPYQDLIRISRIGQELANKYNLEFVAGDEWSKHFKEAQEKAKELGMYRQKYCGCKFSQEEVQSK